MWQLKNEFLLITAMLTAASCGGTSSVPTAPTGVSEQAVSAAPSAQVIQPTTSRTSGNGSTMFGHPVSGTGAANNNCQTQSPDPFGIDMPAVTLPAPVPTVQFGSRLTEVRGTSFVGSRRGQQQRRTDCFR
jgi:hypothetical protein